MGRGVFVPLCLWRVTGRHQVFCQLTLCLILLRQVSLNLEITFFCVFIFSVFVIGCVGPVSHPHWAAESLSHPLLSVPPTRVTSFPCWFWGIHTPCLLSIILHSELSPWPHVIVKEHLRAWLCACTFIWAIAFTLPFCFLNL